MADGSLLSDVDDLTQLPTRAASLQALRQRLATESELYCLVFDVDGFERLNAHLGSEASDEVLVGLAAALSDMLPDCFVGRLSGDQFIAISGRELTSLERSSLTIFEVDTSSGLQTVQVSAGLSSSLVSGSQTDDVLRDALAALLVAKTHGKQRLVVATPDLCAGERARMRLASDTRLALESNDLVAWVQPICDLTTDSPAGFELLARWPRHGQFESPALFVPVIESLGLSFQLGEFMVREAASLLSRLTDEGHPDIFVSINVSAQHIAEPLLPSLIGVQLERRNLDPSRLLVELTESEQMPDTDGGRTAIKRLRTLGVGVASDDVGAGWSSLSQMTKSGFTHVKTDRGLIEATSEPGGAELIRAIRLMAEGAGQVAIAEGIETSEELAAVREAGFTLGQGWFLQRPQPIEQAVAALN